MKLFSKILIIIALSQVSQAATYTFESDGLWTDHSNWDAYPGTTINSGDSVFVSADLILNTGITVNGNLTVNPNKMLTTNWGVTVHGSIQNNGDLINNSQILIFGDGENQGFWHNDSGGLIVANTGSFSTYGELINDESVLGYIGSEIFIAGNFTNNESFTVSSMVSIKQESNEQFYNTGFININGILRLEGTFVNQSIYMVNFNPTSTFILANNSKMVNNGTIIISGLMQQSTLMSESSTMGNIVVSGNMEILASILEIL